MGRPSDDVSSEPRRAEHARRRLAKPRGREAELCLLGVLHRIEHGAVSTRHPAPNALALRADCRGEVYRTYRHVVAFIRDHGRPPTTLGEIVGRYASATPADPVTKAPLIYEVEGKKFRLSCPGS